MKKRILALITALLTLAAVLPAAVIAAPEGFDAHDFDMMRAFLETEDGSGVKNGFKIKDEYDPDDPSTWTAAYIDDDDNIVQFGVNWGVIVDSDRRISHVDFDRRGMTGALDLSGLDHMQKLYTAYGTMTSVVVSGCTALIGAAFEHNAVTTVDLTGCAALTELYCTDNLLTSLQLSPCAALTTLECDDNLLTSLDLSDNPELTALDCHGNPLTSIILTDNPDLASLNCLGTKLKTIDLSACPKLNVTSVSADGNGTVGYIQGIEKNPDGLEEYRIAAEAVCDEGASFVGWYNASGTKLTSDPVLDLDGSSETVLVARFSGNSHAPAKPVISLENLPETGKVKATWAAVENAVKYEVWRSAEKNGEYKLMLTTKNLSYTNTGAKAGDKYYYKVRAVDADGVCGEFSSAKYRTTDLPRPVVTGTHVASTGKNKLTWEAVEGAKEYRVYRSEVKDGEYALMMTTTKTSYTNTGSVAGTTYYYYVVAAHEDSAADSAASLTKQLTCDLARPTVSVSLTAKGKPKLEWGAVEGAKEYKVYRSVESGSGYSLVFTTTNLSYTNTGAVSGTTYYYKVMAIHEKSAANSAYSAEVSVTAN